MQSKSKERREVMSVLLEKQPFGVTKNKEQATRYILENSCGMKVTITDYGANIVNIYVPDKNGEIKDVLLGYDDVSGYEVNAPGHGSFLGRHANRIAKAKFTLNGTEYRLEQNDGENCLHSGSRSYNKYLYHTDILEGEHGQFLKFSRISPDMEQGFPGNLEVSVSYSLSEENELIITYDAVSDKDTVINFTNHSYFNLAGEDAGSVLHHKAKILADQYTETDSQLIPTGVFTDVAGTPLDFREFKEIGRDINADFPALRYGNGYDQNFVLHTKRGEVQRVAELWEEESGRFMEVFTDLPGLQFYSANFLSEKDVGKGGRSYKPRAGICFETQFYPNSINMEHVPNGRLAAGEKFKSTTIYKFSVR